MKLRTGQRFEVLDRQRFHHAWFLALLLVAVTPAFGSGLRVVFVDSARAGGEGTYEKPFATIGEAVRVSAVGTVIFVAEAGVAYEGSVTLRRGQMLIGSAFGLDTLRAEMKIEFEAPPLPAATGTGPLIHGMITMSGDNIVAGCTVIADHKTGVALAADTPDGAITIRKTYVRASQDAWALYVNNDLFPLTWTVGAIDASEHGSGVLVNGGNANVTIDRVAIRGEFGEGIAIRSRAGGTVAFRNAPIKIRDASRDAVAITQSKGSIEFDSPLQITTTGGRGFVSIDAQNVRLATAPSWIETTNATALTIHNSGVQATFDHISAAGKSTDGIVIDKMRGGLDINGGTIENALAYGIRVTQSANVNIRNVRITGGGVASTKECSDDVWANTNLKCRAGLYLRHVERSAFENITIEDNGGVGVNANNLSDATFADIKVSRTGEAALLVDEARGNIVFARCSLPSVVVEQQFNSARMSFDRCDIGTATITARNHGSLCIDANRSESGFHINGKNVKVGGCS